MTVRRIGEPTGTADRRPSSACPRDSVAVDDPTASGSLGRVKVEGPPLDTPAPLLAYVLHTYGKTSAARLWTSGDRGRENLGISRARPRHPEATRRHTTSPPRMEPWNE